MPDADGAHIDEEEDTPAQKETRMTTNKVSLPHNQALQSPRRLTIPSPLAQSHELLHERQREEQKQEESGSHESAQFQRSDR
jgi:hypothetical protein